MKKNFTMKNNNEILIQFFLFITGLLPILLTILSALKTVPIYSSIFLIALAASIFLLRISLTNPKYRQIVIEGILSGAVAGMIAAVFCDIIRMLFNIRSAWPEFIPRVEDYIINQHDHSHSLIFWRSLGIVGGIGLSFYIIFPVVKRKIGSTKGGIIYSVIILSSLLGAAYLYPGGATYFLRSSPLETFFGPMGYIIYGHILGVIVWYLNPEFKSKGTPHIVKRRWQYKIIGIVNAVFDSVI